MRSFLFLAIAALALFAGLSAASPASAAHVASSSDLLAQYVENEPSAMFSRRQLAERPSRVKSKKLAARASPTPVSYNYNIQVTRTDGTVLGYLTRGTGNTDGWIYTTSKTNAVAFAAPSSGASRNLQFASSGNNMVGAVVGPYSTSDQMGPGLYNYVPYTGTAATSPGSVPMLVSSDFNTETGKQQKSESAVWTYDSSSGALNVVWVNPDGSRITLSHLVSYARHYLISTGDVAKVRARFTERYDSVTLKLVKI